MGSTAPARQHSGSGSDPRSQPLGRLHGLALPAALPAWATRTHSSACRPGPCDLACQPSHARGQCGRVSRLADPREREPPEATRGAAPPGFWGSTKPKARVGAQPHLAPFPGNFLISETLRCVPDRVCWEAGVRPGLPPEVFFLNKKPLNTPAPEQMAVAPVLTQHRIGVLLTKPILSIPPCALLRSPPLH